MKHVKDKMEHVSVFKSKLKYSWYLGTIQRQIAKQK